MAFVVGFVSCKLDANQEIAYEAAIDELQGREPLLQPLSTKADCVPGLEQK